MKQSTGEAAQDIRINGSGVYRDDVQAETVRIAGHGRFEGNLAAGSFKSSGSCRVKGLCSARRMSNIGHAHFRSVTAGHIYTAGSFQADESVEADTFHAKGIITIGDTLKAGEIRIELQGAAAIKRIYAERSIDLRADRLSVMNWLQFWRRKAICDSLESPRIEVSHLEAELVAGEEIRIGAGCIIGEVRYSKTLVVDPRSVVKRTVHISI